MKLTHYASVEEVEVDYDDDFEDYEDDDFEEEDSPAPKPSPPRSRSPRSLSPPRIDIVDEADQVCFQIERVVHRLMCSSREDSHAKGDVLLRFRERTVVVL